MRTTIDLEEDVLRVLRDRAHRQRTSLKAALNSAIRLGLTPARRTRAAPRYRCPTFAMGRLASTGISLDKALALADALEDAEVARELEMRK